MKNKVVTVMITLLLAFFFLPGFVFAETVVLKSGKTIEGKIIEDTDSYVKLETLEGQPLYFYKDTIASIKSDSETSCSSSVEPAFKTGLLDFSGKGYMVFVPKDISSSTPILICLPGWGIKTKQDINNWVFTAGKKGFAVLGLDLDYNYITSLSDVRDVYSKISGIVDLLAQEYHISKNKLYLAGTSAGGMMSISLALNYPGKFMAIGVVSGGRLGFGAQEKIKNARGSCFFMIHGDKDERIPIGEFQSTKRHLERNGAIIEYNIIPGGRHTLNSNAYKEVVNRLSDSGSAQSGR